MECLHFFFFNVEFVHLKRKYYLCIGKFALMKREEIQATAKEYLSRFYGYPTFRPGQLDIITECVSGRDVTVLMPTGGGKSICYQIPAIMMEGCAIVVSPLIALMHDQVTALIANGIPAAEVNSNIDEASNRRVMEELYAGHVKILYMSPERLLTDLQRLSSDIHISLFAIDEAHCISQWGHDFRPVYTSLSFIKENYPDTPVMALTATADRITRDDIVRQLKLKDPFNYIGSFDRPNISISVMPSPSASSKITIIGNMINKYRNDSGIVYCTSRKTTETVFKNLIAKGYKAAYYHAGMTAAARERAQTAFINGDVQVICATVAFGMGIDKSNIRWIVHYNMPSNIESYYQEVGRAGRDGMPAEALMFYSLADVMLLRRFAEESGQQAVVLDKLRSMQAFAEAKVCRRRILLSYFNEEITEDCHNCDVCRNPPERIDGTVLAQKAMSAIIRTGSDIGMYMTVDILRGATRADITAKGYHLIKTYGAGRDLSLAEWNYYMLQMLQLGIVETDYNRGKKLSVTSYGMDILKGGKTIEFTKYAVPQKPSASKTTKKSLTSAPAASPQLIDLLKKVRKEEASRTGMPAYLVFSDATLVDMARRRPLTKEAFAQVSGVGEKKLERFWRIFVDAIRSFNG